MTDSNTIEHADRGEYMLTTYDNPYSPFTRFNEWYAFDVAHGYHSASFLARIAATSDDLSEADQGVAIQLAIAEIVQENVLGMWTRVHEQDFNSDGLRTIKTSDQSQESSQ